MDTSMIDLLRARAVAMASQDGVSPGVLQVQGAANQLQAELLAARDNLLSSPVVPVAPSAPEPVDQEPEARPIDEAQESEPS